MALFGGYVAPARDDGHPLAVLVGAAGHGGLVPRVPPQLLPALGLVGDALVDGDQLLVNRDDP